MISTTDKLTSYHALKNGEIVSFYILKGMPLKDAVFLAEVHQKGYAITSRKYRSAGRIDRLDWREYMAKEHAPWDPEGQGMEWVACLDLHGHSAADYYRRCYTRDQIIIPEHLTKYVPKSSPGPREYQE